MRDPGCESCPGFSWLPRLQLFHTGGRFPNPILAENPGTDTEFTAYMYCSISLNSVVCPSQFSATLTSLTRPFTLDIPAEMAELADALDSGSVFGGFRM